MKSLKESWLDTTTTHGKYVVYHFCWNRGKHPGRPKNDEEKVNYASYLLDQGMNRIDAAEKAGISRMTLNRKMQK